MLVRYADDLVVPCRSREEAEAALALLRDLVGELGLELKAEKTRIVHLTEGGEGFDFLGFEHRWVRAKRGSRVRFLARWLSRRAMQHARDRIRVLTEWKRALLGLRYIVAEVNRFLRGWAGYFWKRYGNTTPAFGKLRAYAALRIAALWGKLRRWRHRLRAAPYLTAERQGLMTLDGWVVAPRSNRPWRGMLHAVR